VVDEVGLAARRHRLLPAVRQRHRWVRRVNGLADRAGRIRNLLVLMCWRLPRVLPLCRSVVNFMIQFRPKSFEVDKIKTKNYSKNLSDKFEPNS
jgi:hypothetical protein